MQKEAEAHASDDAKKKEMVEVKNLAEQLIYTTEKALKEAEGKITPEIKKEVETKVEELKKVKDGEDMATIKTATENLSKEIQKIGEYMQKNSSDQQTSTSEKEPKEAEKTDEKDKEGDQNKEETKSQ